MQFTVQHVSAPVSRVFRALGYVPAGTTPDGEYNAVRCLTSGGYPRFHIYLKEAGGAYVFNLHYDAKKPTYAGSHAHSGEYAGEKVEAEAARIGAELARL